jgi:hypothetical protein
MLCYHLPQGDFRIDRNALDDGLLAAQSPIKTERRIARLMLVTSFDALVRYSPPSLRCCIRHCGSAAVGCRQSLLLPSLVRQASEDRNGRQIRLLLVWRSVDPSLYLFFIDGQMYRRRFCCRGRGSSPLPWECAAAGPQAAASGRRLNTRETVPAAPRSDRANRADCENICRQSKAGSRIPRGHRASSGAAVWGSQPPKPHQSFHQVILHSAHGGWRPRP